MSSSDIQEKIMAVERITKLFRVERIVYIIVIFCSLLILFVSAGKSLYKGEAGSIELTLMFGSSGLITYTSGRLLNMWQQSLKIIAAEKGEQSK